MATDLQEAGPGSGHPEGLEGETTSAGSVAVVAPGVNTPTLLLGTLAALDKMLDYRARTLEMTYLAPESREAEGDTEEQAHDNMPWYRPLSREALRREACRETDEREREEYDDC